MTCVVKHVRWEGKCDMIDSYKNTERLRYNVKRDLESLYLRAKADSEEQRCVFIDECFSAILSSVAAVLISLSTLEPIKAVVVKVFKVFKKTPCESVIDLITLILCAILLVAVAFLANFIIVQIQRKFRQRKPEGEDNACYYKKFDDVTCNGIMVAIDYTKIYKKIEDKSEKTLYYLETLYHVNSAIGTMERLVERKEIQNKNNVVGVASYRVNNVCGIVENLITFLKSENKNIDLTGTEKENIKKCLAEYSNRLVEIVNHVNEI